MVANVMVATVMVVDCIAMDCIVKDCVVKDCMVVDCVKSALHNASRRMRQKPGKGWCTIKGHIQIDMRGVYRKVAPLHVVC